MVSGFFAQCYVCEIHPKLFYIEWVYSFSHLHGIPLYEFYHNLFILPLMDIWAVSGMGLLNNVAMYFIVYILADTSTHFFGYVSRVEFLGHGKNHIRYYQIVSQMTVPLYTFASNIWDPQLLSVFAYPYCWTSKLWPF